MQQGNRSMPAPRSEGSVDCKQWFGTVFTNDKAGMAAVDRDKVKKVVYEMSKVPAQTSLHQDHPSKINRYNRSPSAKRQPREASHLIDLHGYFRILHTSRTT